MHNLIRSYLVVFSKKSKYIKRLFAYLFLISLAECNTINSNVRRENQQWIALLENNKIEKIRFQGAVSPEKYHDVRYVYCTNKVIITKLSNFLKAKKFIYRDSRYMKGQLPVCNIVLYNEKGNSHTLLLNKNIYSKGLIESFRSDSIYQNNAFVYFADSVFRANINRASKKPYLIK